jgi:hypothetical protein
LNSMTSAQQELAERENCVRALSAPRSFTAIFFARLLHDGQG